MAKTKQTKVKHYTKRDCMAFAYLAPWIIGMLVLQLYPFLSSLAYSFCNYKITGTPQFAGLANYVQLFTLDNEFWNSLKVTLVYTLYTVPGKLVMALAGMVPWCAETKSIRPNDRLSTSGRAAMSYTSCSAPWVSISK